MTYANTTRPADPVQDLPKTLREAAVAHREGRVDDAWPRYRRFLARNPEHPVALELCGLLFSRFDGAESAFRRQVESGRNPATGWFSLGNVHQRSGEHDVAISCYQRALTVRPRLARARHRLGQCLRMSRRPQAALREYRRASSRGVDHAQLHHDVGLALVDVREIDAAIAAFRAALRRDARHVPSHRALNSLLWQQDRVDEYLASYGRALRRHPREQGLRCAYATGLLHAGRGVCAEGILRDGLAGAPDSAALNNALAAALEAQGRWREALEYHARAVAAGAAGPAHHVDYARALLARGRPREALGHARLGAERMPFDQRALAYLGLCWRLLGDDRDARLNDYDNLVVTRDLPLPPGYADIASFNAPLTDALDRLHTGKRHPAEQSPRVGIQTTGDLLGCREPEIEALLPSLRRCVADYVAELPDDPEHPLFARRSAAFEFSASWSVKLEPRGYHEMHVHPRGWLSAVYYVQVPDAVARRDDVGGALQFGVPDIDVGEQGEARRSIRPAAGRLVVFPSYLWHGTVPYEAEGHRTTIAFDVVPHA